MNYAKIAAENIVVELAPDLLYRWEKLYLQEGEYFCELKEKVEVARKSLQQTLQKLCRIPLILVLFGALFVLAGMVSLPSSIQKTVVITCFSIGGLFLGTAVITLITLSEEVNKGEKELIGLESKYQGNLEKLQTTLAPILDIDRTHVVIKDEAAMKHLLIAAARTVKYAEKVYEGLWALVAKKEIPIPQPESMLQVSDEVLSAREKFRRAWGVNSSLQYIGHITKAEVFQEAEKTS